MPQATLSRIYCLTALFALLLGGTGGIILAEGPHPHVPPSSPRPLQAETVAPATSATSRIQNLPLFALPALGNLPDTRSFVYSIPEQRLLSPAYEMTPLNVGNDDQLTWSLAQAGDWFTAAPASGVTPSSSFWITPTTFSTDTVASYTSTVTVTVTDPSGSAGSPHQIGLTLRVVDTPFSYTHLPLIARDYTPPSPSPLYPNDTFYNNQWALEKVNAPAAWGHSTGQGVLVAIVDTGIDLAHPDLASKVRTDIDWDFANADASADDDHGHGTHVSGIAAAETDNSAGIAGMGWEATLLPLKILRADGYGSDTDLAEAICYAADNGASIVNMSLGATGGCPQIIQQAVDYAYARGAVLVAAAGNDLGHTEMYPANCEHVLGVAATASSDTRASYSNYGSHVSVAAPGSNIYSTLWGGDYGNMSGTSMATPYVAGLAALLLARHPSYTPDQIASAILDNSADLGAPGWDEYYGCGRINAADALSVGAHSSSPICLQGVGPWSAGAASATTSAPFVPGEIILSFQPGIVAEQAALRYGASAEFLPAIRAWRIRVPPGQEQTILAQLRTDPAVVYADLNHLVSAQ